MTTLREEIDQAVRIIAQNDQTFSKTQLYNLNIQRWYKTIEFINSHLYLGKDDIFNLLTDQIRAKNS
jgi:hypothetical protein